MPPPAETRSPSSSGRPRTSALRGAPRRASRVVRQRGVGQDCGDASQLRPLARGAARLHRVLCRSWGGCVLSRTPHGVDVRSTTPESVQQPQASGMTCGQNTGRPPTQPIPPSLPCSSCHLLCLRPQRQPALHHPGLRTRISNGSLPQPTGSLYASVTVAALGVP